MWIPPRKFELIGRSAIACTNLPGVVASFTDPLRANRTRSAPFGQSGPGTDVAGGSNYFLAVPACNRYLSSERLVLLKETFGAVGGRVSLDVCLFTGTPTYRRDKKRTLLNSSLQKFAGIHR